MPLREVVIVCAVIFAGSAWPMTQFLAQNFINVDANGKPLFSDERRTNTYFASDKKVTSEDIRKYRIDFPITGDFVDEAVQLRRQHSRIRLEESRDSGHEEIYSNLEELSEL